MITAIILAAASAPVSLKAAEDMIYYRSCLRAMADDATLEKDSDRKAAGMVLLYCGHLSSDAFDGYRAMVGPVADAEIEAYNRVIYAEALAEVRATRARVRR